MRSFIMDCGNECSFKLFGGGEIRSLKGLSESLGKISDDVFRHHANEERNDFSSWVRDVLNDEKLADDLLGAKDKNSAQAAVLRRVIEVIKEIAE